MVLSWCSKNLFSNKTWMQSTFLSLSLALPHTLPLQNSFVPYPWNAVFTLETAWDSDSRLWGLAWWVGAASPGVIIQHHPNAQDGPKGDMCGGRASQGRRPDPLLHENTTVLLTAASKFRAKHCQRHWPSIMCARQAGDLCSQGHLGAAWQDACSFQNDSQIRPNRSWKKKNDKTVLQRLFSHLESMWSWPQPPFILKTRACNLYLDIYTCLG